MVNLIAAEGDILNAPLTNEECGILEGDSAVSPELSAKAKYLIAHIFEIEKQEDSDPRSFENSMAWASDGASSNIVQLTYEVADGLNSVPRSQGWKRVKDRFALVGCGLIVVLLMFAAVTGAGFIFHWK